MDGLNNSNFVMVMNLYLVGELEIEGSRYWNYQGNQAS